MKPDLIFVFFFFISLPLYGSLSELIGIEWTITLITRCIGKIKNGKLGLNGKKLQSDFKNF
jgi:hypothetical protein